MNTNQIHNKLAVITGASRGIGAEIAKQLAAKGVNLLLVARNHQELVLVSEKLTLDYKIQCDVLALDLSLESACMELAEAAKQKQSDLFIHAAGYGTSGNFIESDLSHELNMLDLNCRSVLILTHLFAAQFKQKGKGEIVLISSVLGFQGVTGVANYAATKAYVLALSEGLVAEFKKDNVNLLVASPGPTRTGFEKRANMQLALGMSSEKVAKAIVNSIGRKNRVIPGWLSKVLHFSMTGLPRFVRTKIYTQALHKSINH